MTFQEFTSQLKFFLVRDFGYDEDKLKLLPKGYTPSSAPEANLIRDTNLRYFNKEADTLLGNFLFINYPEFNSSGCSSEKHDRDGQEKLVHDGQEKLVYDNQKKHEHDGHAPDDQEKHAHRSQEKHTPDDQEKHAHSTEEENGPKEKDVVQTFERLNLDSMYADCEKNGFESVLAHLRKTRSQVQMAENTKALDHVDEYDRVKESLIIRPLNFNAHRRSLKDNIYRRVGDIALVLYILFAHGEGSYMSGRVPREAFKEWGITEDEAIDEALKNTERIHPATLSRIVRKPIRQAMISTYKPMGLLRELTEDITDVRMVSISGKDNPNGSVSLFFPGVQELLFEKIGRPYYVAFIGVDGAVIHSVDQVDPKTVLHSLKDTNTQYNRAEDVLSTHVYEYDGRKLEIVRV